MPLRRILVTYIKRGMEGDHEMEKVKVCRGEMVKDPVTGYKFRFTGDCADTIDGVMKDLPPHTRRYLEKRIEIVEEG